MPRPISTDAPKLNGVPTKHADICRRFRKCRVDNQMTQGEFAVYLGIGLSLVKQIEYGECAPNYDIIRQLHKGFRLSYEYLLDGKKDVK